jgi:hypothetical protein
MAIVNWSIAPANALSDTTKIKDADNKLQASIEDLVRWVNSDGIYAFSGVTHELNSKITEVDNAIVDINAEFDRLEIDLTALINALNFNTNVTEW